MLLLRLSEPTQADDAVGTASRPGYMITPMQPKERGLTFFGSNSSLLMMGCNFLTISASMLSLSKDLHAWHMSTTAWNDCSKVAMPEVAADILERI